MDINHTGLFIYNVRLREQKKTLKSDRIIKLDAPFDALSQELLALHCFNQRAVLLGTKHALSRKINSLKGLQPSHNYWNRLIYGRNQAQWCQILQDTFLCAKIY